MAQAKGMWTSKYYTATRAFVTGLQSLNARIDRRAARRELR